MPFTYETDLGKSLTMPAPFGDVETAKTQICVPQRLILSPRDVFVRQCNRQYQRRSNMALLMSIMKGTRKMTMMGTREFNGDEHEMWMT